MKKYLTAAVVLFLVGCNQPEVIPFDITPKDISRVDQSRDFEVKFVRVELADPTERSGELRIQPDYLQAWGDTIRVSLDKAGLFRDESSSKIDIICELKKFEFNPNGFSNTVDIEAKYKIVRRASNKVIWSAVFKTSKSSNCNETWNANLRLRKLLNESTQDNISQFVKLISSSDLDKK